MADLDGTAKIEGLSAGAYLLSVACDAEVWTSSVPIVLLPSASESIIVRCAVQEHAILGRAVGRDGVPLAGVLIQVEQVRAAGAILDLWAGEPGEREVASGVDGAFLVGNLPAGLFRLTAVSAAGDETIYREVHTPPGEITIMFGAALEIVIEGRCSTAAGLPVAGASVRAAGAAEGVGESGPDGSYVLFAAARFPRGEVGLVASCSGYRDARAATRLEGLSEERPIAIDFLLEARQGEGAIAGTLRDADGSPIPGLSVMAESRSAGSSSSAKSDPLGEFSFEGLEAGGDYSITVLPARDHEGLVRQGLVVADGRILELDLVLAPSGKGSIEGKARDAARRRLAGLHLRVSDECSLARGIDVVTGPDGSFSASDVPAGSLVVTSPEIPGWTAHGIRLEPGSEVELDLAVGLGELELSGLVLDRSGGPCASVDVTLLWSHSGGAIRDCLQVSTATDCDGRFHLGRLPAGTCSVWLRAPGGDPQVEERSLRRSEEWTFRLQGPRDSPSSRR